MAIRKQQILALKAGDVIFLKFPISTTLCMVVLEREHAKLVLSVGAGRVEDLIPVRCPQWEYLTVDEAGGLCGPNGEDVTELFLDGEILIGKAMDVAKKYRSRIMPDTKLVRGAIAPFEHDDPERTREILRNILQIHYMCFNNDYKGNHVLAFEMFARLVKGTPSQDMPTYLCALMDTLGVASQVRGIICAFDPGTADVSAGKEVQDLLDKMRPK